MADYNSDRTGSNIDLTLDKVDALDAKVQPTVDGITVDGATSTDGILVQNPLSGSFYNANIEFRRDTTLGGAKIQTERNSSGGVGLSFNRTANNTAETNGTYSKAINIANSGDVSFYEDTGTTAKMVWDASAESLGIGTASPSLSSFTASATGLHLKGAAPALRLEDTSGENTYIAQLNENLYISNQATNGVIRLLTNNTERLRIDSSGNLLVGTTDAGAGVGNTNSGIILGSNNSSVFSRSGASGQPTMYINKNTNDGTLVQFNKDGATVGSIGTVDGFPYISSNSNVGLKFLSLRIRPVNSDGSDRDAAIDLGATSARFDDIYAINGTIQTSDRNEKQDIAELSDAEQRVAQACKGLLRKFRWKSKVEEKGDDARIHFGIIAQDLQDAFTAEGLDAGRYAMFISTTWTDEETGEERTRLGVRYPELLAFIISAL